MSSKPGILSFKALKQAAKESQALKAPPPAASGTPPPPGKKKALDTGGSGSTNKKDRTPDKDPVESTKDSVESTKDPDLHDISKLVSQGAALGATIEEREKAAKEAYESRFPTKLLPGEFQDTGIVERLVRMRPGASNITDRLREAFHIVAGGTRDTDETNRGRMGVPVAPSSKGPLKITTREGGLENVTKKFTEMQKQVDDLAKEKEKIKALRNAFGFDRFVAQHLRVQDPNNLNRDTDIVPFIIQKVPIPRSELTAQQIGILSGLEGTELGDDKIVVDAMNLAEKMHLLDTKLSNLESDIKKSETITFP